MPTFSSKPLGGQASTPAGATIAKLTPQVRKHPVLLFGLPFVLTIVAGSYGLSHLTQTRYDYNATKVQSVSKEEELGMRKDRRRVDIREEYYRLQAKDSELDEWEPKRIERPAGVPEWGVPPTSRTGSTIQNEELGPGQVDAVPDYTVKKGRGQAAGVILGPDGKPCRACNSKLAFANAMRISKPSSSRSTPKDDGDESTLLTSSLSMLGGAAAASSSSSTQSPDACPPDGEAIGNNTWTFLHSSAAYFPAQPSAPQQSAMLALIRSLPHLYPCYYCADHLAEELQREEREGKSWEGGKVLKEAIKTGPGLRKWLCGLHNEVNTRLGKATFPCDDKVLQTKWLTGPEDGSCD